MPDPYVLDPDPVRHPLAGKQSASDLKPGDLITLTEYDDYPPVKRTDVVLITSNKCNCIQSVCNQACSSDHIHALRCGEDILLWCADIADEDSLWWVWTYV